MLYPCRMSRQLVLLWVLALAAPLCGFGCSPVSRDQDRRPNDVTTVIRGTPPPAAPSPASQGD